MSKRSHAITKTATGEETVIDDEAEDGVNQLQENQCSFVCG